MSIKRSKYMIDDERRKIYRKSVSHVVKRPIPLVPISNPPTDEDYEIGYMRRFFARQTNSPESIIVEVDESTFHKLKASETSDGYYTVVEMNWRIKGPLTDEVKKGIYQKGVLQANNDSLKIAETKISGIKDVVGSLVRWHLP